MCSATDHSLEIKDGRSLATFLCSLLNDPCVSVDFASEGCGVALLRGVRLLFGRTRQRLGRLIGEDPDGHKPSSVAVY